MAVELSEKFEGTDSDPIEILDQSAEPPVRRR
jgi:hypothetical protein